MLQRLLTLAVVIPLCLSGCSDSKPAGACSGSASCDPGSVCVDGRCETLCLTQRECPADRLCGSQGYCVVPSTGDLPLLDSIAGNDAADSTRVMDGLLVRGDALEDAVFELQGASADIALTVRSQDAESAELVFPPDIRSGSYTLVATNQAGSNQATVTLTLPEITSELVLERLNAATGTVEVGRLPVGTAGGTVAAGDHSHSAAEVSTLVTSSLTSGALPYASANALADTNVAYDAANQRVGIGTTTPSTELEVAGAVTATQFIGEATSAVSAASATGLVTGAGGIYHQLLAQAMCGALLTDTGPVVPDSNWGIIWKDDWVAANAVCGSSGCDEACPAAGFTGAAARYELQPDDGGNAVDPTSQTVNNIKLRQGDVGRCNAAYCCCYD